jgi:DNA polymerase-3 subunit gamma/tau
VTTALYRRYRPESFAEVIGQEQVTGPLSIALTKNRVNHAYLFSGPRGCGKTTSARILARCLNCAEGPTPTPCEVCPSCIELARGGPGSLDVVEIDAASHGGVDDARDLRERAAFAPVRDRYKIFIIDEAHMVSPQGFNALLKIVEEPPEHIRFIFATTEPEKVIGTIRSRTHHYPFRLVPPERLTAYLDELCEREGVVAGKGVLPLVVRSGGGSVRDSLSVLDQLIGGAGDEGLTYATAVALLGYTDIALLDDVADALAAADGATVFRVIDRVIESGHDPRRFVEDLLERLRDLLVVAALRDGGHAVFRGLPDDQLERMRSQATRFGAAELSRAADVTNAALTEMTGATSPRLQLELLCARLLLPAAEEGERGFGARLDRLEKRINASGGLAAPSSAPVAPAAPVTAVSVPRPASTRPAEPAARPEPVAAPVATPVAAAQPEAPVQPAQPTRPDQSWPEPARPETRSAWPEPTAAAPAAAPATTAPPSSPQPAPAAPAGTGSGDLEAVRRMWTEVMNALASIKRTTWSLVSQYAQVLDYDGKRLLLGFDSAGRAQSFGRGAHPDFLRQALIDVIGLDCTVEAIASSEFRAGSSRPAAPAAAPARPAPAVREAPREAPRQAPPVSAPSAPRPAQAPSTPPPSAVRTAPAAAQRRPSGPPSSPYDDIPPSLEEPVWDDEVPPDDGRSSGRPAPRRAPERPSGSGSSASSVPASTNPPVASWPTAAQPRGQAAVQPPAPAPVAAPPAPAPARAPAPEPEAAPPTPPAPAMTAQPPSIVTLPDADEPEDPRFDATQDFEQAERAGAQVIQDLLGGRVIEESNP